MRTHIVLACVALATACAPAAAAEPAGTPPAAGKGQVAPVEAPGWVKDIAPGTWSAISKNTPADVDPAKDPKVNPNHPKSPPWNANLGQRGVIACWNGGALATRYGAKGSLLIYGGGHQGYYGNEVYAFDLDTRLWSRATDPWKGPCSFNELRSYPEGRFADGTPTATHTYDMVEYHPGSNSFVPFYGEMNNSGGYTAPVAYLLSLDTRKWQHSPRNEKPHGYGGWSAYDSTRDVFWLEAGGGFAKFDPNVKNADGTVGQWTGYPKKLKPSQSLDVTGAYDPVRDIVVIANFRDAKEVVAMDPKNPAGPAVKLTEAGTGPEPRQCAAGWEWSHVRGAFLYWRRGATVYELKPPAGDWKAGDWTWSALTDAANNKVEPQATGNGVYSRFRVARYADAEVAVVINSITGPVHAFRVPEPAKNR